MGCVTLRLNSFFELLQVAYLGIVGGKSEQDTIERVLSASVGTNVARLFNWNGLKGKRAFSKLELKNVIHGSSAIHFSYDKQ